jgi:hypothetical protein
MSQKNQIAAAPSPHTLTPEQSAIISFEGDLAINAVAGSGKTTTIIEYAAARPSTAKILYLAFNKSVKLEALRKFSDRSLTNVKIETAHSLAYRHIVTGSNYKVKAGSYKTHEIAGILGLPSSGEKHAEYIIANHINKFVTYFCNSDKAKVQDLNYLSTIADPKAQGFIKSFYAQVETGTRQLLAKMKNGEIEITHDFYLKLFQLSNPVLPYDYILFDEAQDASAAMLDVFLKQKGTKVIVGDTHQQIYGWRHAVNSLAKTGFDTLHLSTSFRFPQTIANLAMETLQWKEHLSAYKPVTITGKGKHSKKSSKAIIARTNLGLLLKAIEFITDNRKVKHIYFEGNINSYTYADDGASLYDVLNLYNNKRDRIRDPLIQTMGSVEDLEEYIEKTEDIQLSMMVEIVKEYENEIPAIIKSLKDLHSGDEDRSKAEMIFSTVHRAKGMEYDTVHLVNDFITEARLKKLVAEHKNNKQPLDTVKLNEEINLLYVAITRVKNDLHIPESLMPDNFPVSPSIQVVKAKKESEKSPAEPSYTRKKPTYRKPTGKEIKEKAYSVAEKRNSHQDANKPWTTELDQQLKNLYESGTSVSKMADYFGRNKGAIMLRLKSLNYFND